MPTIKQSFIKWIGQSTNFKENSFFWSGSPIFKKQKDFLWEISFFLEARFGRFSFLIKYFLEQDLADFCLRIFLGARFGIFLFLREIRQNITGWSIPSYLVVFAIKIWIDFLKIDVEYNIYLGFCDIREQMAILLGFYIFVKCAQISEDLYRVD